MIRNVVFDMGGVLIDLAVDRMIAAYGKLVDTAAISQLEKVDLLGNGSGSSLHDYECGLISTEEWVEDTLRSCRPGTTRQQVIDASFTILGEISEQRLDAIRRLRAKGYRTYLLSNIQDLHWDYISSRWLGGIDTPDRGVNDHQLFDGLYLSQRIHHTKPDPEIYEAMIQDSGLVPEETLYFDDVKANIEGGLRFGLQAIQSTTDSWIQIVDKL